MGIVNNKRIAKNTIYLYIRTIVTLFVMLYTSRVVLQALGIEDLGIYNVVGGIISLLSFFQSSLTKATSRFLTYELGIKSSENRLRWVFSLSMTIHIIIVLVIIFLGETIGIFVLKNFTDIPVLRQDAAFFVYQCALMILCLHLVRVPYDAVIVAHENMKVYAYMSIADASLQLVMAYILIICEGDKLVVYGCFMLFIAFILYLAYYFYVRQIYSFYRFRFQWNKEYSVNIISFSGWSLLGSSANVATQQGISLLFNNFVGLFANAALGFANQVNGAVSRFVYSFATAFNPQIIKLCAQFNYNEMFILMNRASKFSFALIWIMTLPLLANIEYVLNIWLGDVPKYTGEFCSMILICSIIDAITGIYNTAITATGRIRNYQILLSCSFFMDLCFAFILLKLKCFPPLVFGSRILTRGFFNMFIGWYFVHKQIGFNIKYHLKVVFKPIIVTVLSTAPSVLIVKVFCESAISRLLLSIIVSLVLVTASTYTFLMDENERFMLKTFVRNKFK